VESKQAKRKQLCSEVQKIVADDLPYIPIWFTDVVSVHRRELGDLAVSPTGEYDFLVSLKPRVAAASTAR
jgi:ABC-type transport system substrate-binding protein